MEEAVKSNKEALLKAGIVVLILILTGALVYILRESLDSSVLPAEDVVVEESEEPVLEVVEDESVEVEEVAEESAEESVQEEIVE